MDEKRYILSLLVENEFGSLSRISGLFSARGYNIHCLNVAPTDDESISRMTIVTMCNEQKINQLMRQLDKLVDVLICEISSYHSIMSFGKKSIFSVFIFIPFVIY